MLKIEVMGYREALDYVYNYSGEPDKEKYAIISIQEPTNGYGLGVQFCVGGNCKAALNIEFADITPAFIQNEEDEKEWGYQLMSADDASKIHDFIESLPEGIDKLIIHCHAGVSRSAAVAAALSLVKNGSDKMYFNKTRYVPNMWVYRKVLEAYGLSNSYKDSGGG